MNKTDKNYAFIDAQNVHLGILEFGWKMDWRKFRVWLRNKFGIEKALIFIGYHKGNEGLYRERSKIEYIPISEKGA